MRNIEAQLESMFSANFRRIWVQRGKYSLCLTLFPHVGSYRIITVMNVFHGFSQEPTAEDVLAVTQNRIQELI